MKYTLDIDIQVPRSRVIELFDSTENLKEWQPGLISFDHVSGEPGEVGAKSKIVYRMGKRQCEMIETITVKNLPDEFTGTYDSDGVWNEVKNRFVAVDDNTTKWVSDIEFKSDKLMIKLMMFLMPGMFKKESLKFMQNFKAFAEREG